MTKLAIIGASELQNPLIEAANERGLETHVFAWQAGAIGEHTAHEFHPLSITEFDAISRECERLGVAGVCTIASDLANVCVGHVTHQLGLPGNSPECVLATTNKEVMRRTLTKADCPSPASIAVNPDTVLDTDTLSFPVIVKPVDRSGSRGITKLDSAEGFDDALRAAFEVGFEAVALVEEYAQGREFSVEYISWQGVHHFLALTEKMTTGAPHFIETAHIQPADVSPLVLDRIKQVCSDALCALGQTMGASHCEVKVDDAGAVRIIEIGSRMGGDCIGSHLVPLSTGYDFVGAVIDCALGLSPCAVNESAAPKQAAAVRYVLQQRDVDALARLQAEHPSWVRFASPLAAIDHAVDDSSARFGFAVMAAPTREDLLPYLV